MPSGAPERLEETTLDASTWRTIERLREWLDTESPVPPDAARLLRVLKIGDEFGAGAEAVR
ncbi:hypothetical protein PV963_19800 [Streptomyces coeruleorubidus]|uniref:hypothetical protein n=1 Tax=Streptomyces coeruleorubidus TaxID=116188 RepID=UPI00237FB307|nr:hypothetical protein [Streptomyces coeruleorubidus]WDV57079.1 hypothetical protein PV963_19800 [Streptomyces coeruleorubidus]